MRIASAAASPRSPRRKDRSLSEAPGHLDDGPGQDEQLVLGESLDERDVVRVGTRR
jgi:hypothetical protein